MQTTLLQDGNHRETEPERGSVWELCAFRSMSQEIQNCSKNVKFTNEREKASKVHPQPQAWHSRPHTALAQPNTGLWPLLRPHRERVLPQVALSVTVPEGRSAPAPGPGVSKKEAVKTAGRGPLLTWFSLGCIPWGPFLISSP